LSNGCLVEELTAKNCSLQLCSWTISGCRLSIKAVIELDAGEIEFVADRILLGDNLSERSHIQNSISLTIVMPPRIIAASTSTKREP
jgi:hypothetical protein